MSKNIFEKISELVETGEFDSLIESIEENFELKKDNNEELDEYLSKLIEKLSENSKDEQEEIDTKDAEDTQDGYKKLFLKK